MIVAELNFVCVVIHETETDTPLVVHRDRVLPGTIALERVQAIPWRNTQIGELRRAIHSLELAEGSSCNIGRHTFRHPRPEQLFRLSVGEGLDHTEV